MEVAATVILAAGIPAVVAKSFARTFYRNAINNGLLPIECDASAIAEGDQLSIAFDGERVEVGNARSGERLRGRPLPPIMLEILDTGGLVPYMRKHRGFRL